jgi:beta-xylosidase
LSSLDNVYGPYETKVVINDKSTYPTNGLHQGGMVQLKDGTWWFIIMQDRGPIGRTPNLEPVTWVDGWPMLGKDGKGVVTFEKPNVGDNFPVAIPATSDEFNSPALAFSGSGITILIPPTGHLPSTRVICVSGKASDLKHARNTLTQRVQGPTSERMVEMDVRGLKDGDVAGFGIFDFPYAYVAVQQGGDARKIVMINDNKVIATVDNFTGGTVWFKASTTVAGYTASFFYSTDQKTFKPISNELKMGLG